MKVLDELISEIKEDFPQPNQKIDLCKIHVNGNESQQDKVLEYLIDLSRHYRSLEINNKIKSEMTSKLLEGFDITEEISLDLRDIIYQYLDIILKLLKD